MSNTSSWSRWPATPGCPIEPSECRTPASSLTRHPRRKPPALMVSTCERTWTSMSAIKSQNDRAYQRASQELIQRRKERLKAEIGFESQKRAQAAEQRRENAENRRVERHLGAVALDKKRQELADLRIINAAAAASSHFEGILPPEVSKIAA